MFIRQVECSVGGMTFRGDGGNTGFRIQFDIQKTMLGMPNEAQITITNLSNDTIDQLQTRGLPVELQAGWIDEGMTRVFRGDLQASITSRTGADRQTVLKCLDGGQAITYSAGQQTFDTVPISTIVEHLAGVMGVPVGKIAVNGETGFKGRVVSGSASRELDNLAREFHFSWSVQDGEFFALDDADDLADTWLISRATGLQAAKQILSGPLQVATGVEIVALLNPRILPNHRINLQWSEGSDFPRGLAGTYKVHNIGFSGDTHGSDWTMSIQCFTVGGF